MPFGIPSSTDLTGLATQLGGIVASVGPEEQAVLTAAIGQLSDHGAALLTQAGSVIQTDLAPLLAESADWRLEVALFRDEVTALNAKLDRLLNGGLLLTVPKS